MGITYIELSDWFQQSYSSICCSLSSTGIAGMQQLGKCGSNLLTKPGTTGRYISRRVKPHGIDF